MEEVQIYGSCVLAIKDQLVDYFMSKNNKHALTNRWRDTNDVNLRKCSAKDN